MRRLRGVLAAALWGLAACAGGGAEAPEYLHNRSDYAAFRAGAPELLEPNYLPFMATRVELPAPRRSLGARLRGWLGGGGAPPEEALVLCRWEHDAFPLAVYIAPPEIPARLREGLDPRPPAEYVAAVERALALWERGLEGRVSFRRVPSPEQATLRIELLGEEAPEPDPSLRVLGSTRVGDACQVLGGDLESGRLEVRFQVSELRIFVADLHGLLLPDQVERIALHELGHALGMRGHSPIPADLMYRVVRDRLPRGELGTEDVNSFLDLYALPNGTVYRRVPPVAREANRSPRQPASSPRLGLAPHVDPALGYEIQLPAGWTRVSMERGVVAVDGLTWDYDVSFQLLVRPYPSIDAYLQRHAPAYLYEGELREQRELRVAGVPALRFVVAHPGERPTVEELTFLEPGDGRVLVAIAECPAELHGVYRDWFAAILASLELRGGGAAEDRDYSTRPVQSLPGVEPGVTPPGDTVGP